MTSRRSSSHADNKALSSATTWQPPLLPAAATATAASTAPKLHVKRSLSQETITIHFSAMGKEEEEEEEEELYGSAVSSPTPAKEGRGIVTALEANEALFEAVELDSPAEAAVLPVSSSSTSTLTPKAVSLGSISAASIQNFFSLASEKSSAPPPAPALSSNSTPNSSPSRSATSGFQGDKPFFSLVKSLSSDIEPVREGIIPPPASAPPSSSVRHRQLMKNLVKSLSSDTSSQDSSSSSSSSPYRLPDSSRLNLTLFKQFTQSRAPAAAAAGSGAGDSKTAPSSPMTSTDSRSFFKVSEVEARIEDTKRRLSEVMYEPLQLFSKMMGDESGGGLGGGSSIYRPSKALSSSATELTTLVSLNNGLAESNNNSYSIKEEEGSDWEGESPTKGAEAAGGGGGLSSDIKSTKSLSLSALTSVGLDKCSMSALAKQEDEDFCILYSEDFETCTDTEGGDTGGDRTYESGTGGSGSRARAHASGSTEPCSEDEWGDGEEGEGPSVPHYTLIFLMVLIYGCFVLPLPTYVGGMVFGAGLGFLLAIGVVWLAGPKPSGRGAVRQPRHQGELWNTAQLDIKEPNIFKGWMNEIMNYDPETYHATLTQSVYVRLEGSTLRLSKPNRNIARRAMHNEAKPDVTYISQKIYDLTDSKIYLMPQSLARKRVWNKKYPICITLGKQDDFMSKAEGDRAEPADDKTTTTTTTTTITTSTTSAKGDRGDETGGGTELTLYLFGRTGREKEEWFRRILLASKPKAEMKRATSLVGSKTALSCHSRSSSRGSLDEALASLCRNKDHSNAALVAGGGSARPKPLLDYSVFMAALVPSQAEGSPAAGANATASPVAQSPTSSPGVGKKLPSSPVREESVAQGEEEPVAWVNAVLGRVLLDFLGEPYWADMVSKKIQMKLSKIRLPYFMNELTLTELDMGVATPRILRASKPSVDHQGLWFDLEISYSGSFLMTLETKMNLIRLGKEGEGLRFGEVGKEGYRPRTYCLADSDEESSSAGSSDEEDTSEVTTDTPGAEGYLGGHKPSKIMRFVDKITKSKYFQKATETEFIKKKMEEVSNTRLLLTVEVQELRGTLAVNIPPPPTDRIWYGFRSPPHLELKARPKLGEREVTLAHVTDWIEKKLDQEFQKIFVMPNMDDLWLTIMHSAMDPRTSGGPASTAETQRDPEPSDPEGGATYDI